MMIELPDIPKRPQKPREKGLTMVMDKGISITEANMLMDSSQKFIDIVKFGFGTALITENIEEKIKLYKKHDIFVHFNLFFPI